MRGYNFTRNFRKLHTNRLRKGTALLGILGNFIQTEYKRVQQYNIIRNFRKLHTNRLRKGTTLLGILGNFIQTEYERVQHYQEFQETSYKPNTRGYNITRSHETSYKPNTRGYNITQSHETSYKPNTRGYNIIKLLRNFKQTKYQRVHHFVDFRELHTNRICKNKGQLAIRIQDFAGKSSSQIQESPSQFGFEGTFFNSKFEKVLHYSRIEGDIYNPQSNGYNCTTIDLRDILHSKADRVHYYSDLRRHPSIQNRESTALIDLCEEVLQFEFVWVTQYLDFQRKSCNPNLRG